MAQKFMNKKQHEFAMDTIPDWLRVVADPKSEEDHRLYRDKKNLRKLRVVRTVAGKRINRKKKENKRFVI